MTTANASKAKTVVDGRRRKRRVIGVTWTQADFACDSTVESMDPVREYLWL